MDSRSVDVSRQRAPAVGEEPQPRTYLRRPSQLVALRSAEEVVRRESFLDCRLKHHSPKDQPGGEPLMRFAERGLDQESGPGERAAIVARDQLTVQLKQMQSQPALPRRRLRERAVELLGPGIAEDRRALSALPAGCL